MVYPTSRLMARIGAALSVVALQLIPYTPTGGAGVALGISFVRGHDERRIFGIRVYVPPRQAVLDVGAMYALATPLFLIASLWEFAGPL